MPTFNVHTVDWDELYDGEAAYAPGDPGWNIGELQPEIAALEQRGLFRSPILDSGCGVGVATLALVEKGYTVVGLDVSPAAIKRAEYTAQKLELPAKFGVADLTSATGYTGYFNTVIDGLVLHCLPETQRHNYLASTARSLTDGGTFIALVFSTDAFPPGSEFGPRTFTEAQLRDTVGRYLTVDEIKPARSWVKVPATLPSGFEYRNVTIGSDGRAQLPSWLIIAHRG